ncbi:MAG: fatty acid desaturase [Rhodobacteraceae bacterium]|nr:fatty acid desaturase [Paracoccaceae bacterium]NCW64209.1 fatty acid desaturase [Paracoccaceae bacterium]NCX18795.1 fatty acid desaturase [Paracoccaceae bacterium]NCX82794.1 fatty acid desaturase [Paracoccaceae bacterium]NDD34171.1 fatty acid desaturase [Paracoccaceae bacterium]
MDHKSFLKTLNAKDKARLNARSDARGLRHLMMYCAVLGVMGSWIFCALPLWQIMLIPHGILISFLFTLQHECTHNTPFKTLWLNSIMGHLIAFLLFQPFLWFRYFHLAHHKYTNIPGKDPELDGHEKPSSWGAFVRHLSTVDYWWAKVTTLIGNSVGPLTASYIPPRKRRALRAEAVLLIVAYGVVFAMAPTALLWLWIVPLILGFPVLRLYLLAEHGRCPEVEDMFLNTRTTLTTRVVRFLAWNMPYHAEHHAMPSVPFHKLPVLHDMTAAHLGQVSDGYSGFTKSYVASFRD